MYTVKDIKELIQEYRFPCWDLQSVSRINDEGLTPIFKHYPLDSKEGINDEVLAASQAILEKQIQLHSRSTDNKAFFITLKSYSKAANTDSSNAVGPFQVMPEIKTRGAEDTAQMSQALGSIPQQPIVIKESATGPGFKDWAEWHAAQLKLQAERSEFEKDKALFVQERERMNSEVERFKKRYVRSRKKYESNVAATSEAFQHQLMGLGRMLMGGQPLQPLSGIQQADVSQVPRLPAHVASLGSYISSLGATEDMTNFLGQVVVWLLKYEELEEVILNYVRHRSQGNKHLHSLADSSTESSNEDTDSLAADSE